MQAQAQTPSVRGVNLYSEEREAQAVKAETERIERALSVVQSDALQAYLTQLAGDQFRIVIYREAPKDSDAGPFAMPPGGFANPSGEPVAMSGTIFVSAQMLEESADEAGFARRIAHAMAHVSLRHATKLATKAEIASYAQLPMIFMGGGWAEYGIRQAAQVQIPLGYQKFVKQYEAEADTAAAQIFEGLTLDAAGFARSQAAVR
jgi:Zn-dependent protease with chaperone function